MVQTAPEMLIRRALRDRMHAAAQPGWARIEHHLACGSNAHVGLASSNPTRAGGPSEPARANDDAFWRIFAGHIEVAKQQLPRGADAPPVHATDTPMQVAEFMLAAKMRPRALEAGTPFAKAAQTPAGRHASAFVSPTTVDEARYWLGAGDSGVTPRQSKKKAGKGTASHRKGDAGTAPTITTKTGNKRKGPATMDAQASGTPKSVPAGKRRRRRATAVEATTFQSPPTKGSANQSALFSPGQEAAQSLLALRKGFF